MRTLVNLLWRTYLVARAAKYVYQPDIHNMVEHGAVDHSMVEHSAVQLHFKRIR